MKEDLVVGGIGVTFHKKRNYKPLGVMNYTYISKDPLTKRVATGTSSVSVYAEEVGLTKYLATPLGRKDWIGELKLKGSLYVKELDATGATTDVIIEKVDVAYTLTETGWNEEY